MSSAISSAGQGLYQFFQSISKSNASTVAAPTTATTSASPSDSSGDSSQGVSQTGGHHHHHSAHGGMFKQIQDAVKERKGSVQAPKTVVIADALPVTALGKIDKKALRAKYWTGERAVG